MKQIISAIFLVIIIVAIVVLSFTFRQVEQEKNNLTLDLQHRSDLLAENTRERVESYVVTNSQAYLPNVIENFSGKQRLAGIVVFDNKDTIIASSAAYPKQSKQPKILAATSMDADKNTGDFEQVKD